MSEQHKNGKPGDGETAEPESGTVLASKTIKGQKDSVSREYFYIGERAVAYFEGLVCWYRPGLTTIEFSRVNLEAQKRECAVIHKCPDANDFELAESGTKKLEKAVGLDSVPVYHHVDIMNELLRGHDDLFALHKGHWIGTGALSLVTYKPDNHVYKITVERVKAVKNPEPHYNTREAHCPTCVGLTEQVFIELEGGENGSDWHCQVCKQAVV